MDISNIGGYTLNNLNKINVILGKNGVGKSNLFRLIERDPDDNSDWLFAYLSRKKTVYCNNHNKQIIFISFTNSRSMF